MEQITSPARCTGCAACAARCPMGCITMTPDDEGFLRPSIDHNACIDCGLCAKNCPVNADPADYPRPTAYAAINTDEGERRASSSGGVFARLAHAVLSAGGAVCGPVFDEHFLVRHIVTRDPADIARMQGAKYVQSAIGGVYGEVRALLEDDVPVLFAGTPCQIGGLRAALGREYEGLYTQDIICHGIPSPRVWKKYLTEQDAPVQQVSFRDKSQGWPAYSVRIETAQRTYCQLSAKDPYMRLYLRDLDLRPACYDCAFKTVGRAADLTLADFWGVNRIQPDLHDGKGTTLVLVHSAQGQALLDRAEGLRLAATDLEAAAAANPAIDHAADCPAARASFFKTLDQKTLAAHAEALCRESAADKAKSFLRRAINKLR